MKDPRELLKTILTSDLDLTGEHGGLMLPEQAKKFIDLTLDWSAMLKQVRTEKKTARAGEVDTLNVGEVVTEGASEEPGLGTSPAEEVKPTFSKIEYTMKKLRSMYNITTEGLMDSVEGGGVPMGANVDFDKEPPADFRDTLMKAYSKRIGADLELLAIRGDVARSGSGKEHRLLVHNEGWDKLTAVGVSGLHYLDADAKNVSFDLLTGMIELLPAPYLAQMQNLRWWMGPRTYIQWVKYLVDRETELGDDVIRGGKIAPLGIPIVMVPYIPEDKTGLVGTVSHENCTFIWLTFPENFIYFIRRAVETYWEFVPRRDRWENTTYTETDMQIENIDALVKAVDVKIDATAAYSG